MNWKQFKEYLEAKGVKDNHEIFYIDVYPSEEMDVEIKNDIVSVY